MKTLYTSHATTTGGRAGHTETDDKKVSLDLSPPGSNGPGSNPEQLFACGYSACFGGAVEYIARQQKLEVSPVTVHADVSLNQDDSGGFFIGVTLNVVLPSLDKATAENLVQQAHQVCPYSKATRGNIEVTLKVNDTQLKQAA